MLHRREELLKPRLKRSSAEITKVLTERQLADHIYGEAVEPRDHVNHTVMLVRLLSYEIDEIFGEAS